MERAAMHPAPTWAAHDHGNSYALPVTAFCRVVGQHIKGAGDEINELHLGHGAHSHHGRAARGPDYRALRYRRIYDTVLAKALQESFGHLERAAVRAYVLA